MENQESAPQEFDLSRAYVVATHGSIGGVNKCKGVPAGAGTFYWGTARIDRNNQQSLNEVEHSSVSWNVEQNFITTG